MLVSASLTEGTPRELIRSWHHDSFVLVVNRQLLFELESVLLRKKFRRYLGFGEAIQQFSVWLNPTHDEYMMSRPKGSLDCSHRYGVLRGSTSPQPAVGYVTWLHRQAESISAASGEIPRYAADPDDDYLAALALASEADFLVSGDRHLLDLGEIKDGEGRTLVYVPRHASFWRS